MEKLGWVGPLASPYVVRLWTGCGHFYGKTIACYFFENFPESSDASDV